MLQNMDDKAMVRTVFAKMQLFKGVENYFIDSLLYKEKGKVVEKSFVEAKHLTPFEY